MKLRSALMTQTSQKTQNSKSAIADSCHSPIQSSPKIKNYNKHRKTFWRIPKTSLKAKKEIQNS